MERIIREIDDALFYRSREEIMAKLAAAEEELIATRRRETMLRYQLWQLIFGIEMERDRWGRARTSHRLRRWAEEAGRVLGGPREPAK